MGLVVLLGVSFVSAQQSVSPSTLEETVAQVLQATTMMASTDQAIESQLPASNLDVTGTYRYTHETIVGVCSCMTMASCSSSDTEAAVDPTVCRLA